MAYYFKWSDVKFLDLSGTKTVRRIVKIMLFTVNDQKKELITIKSPDCCYVKIIVIHTNIIILIDNHYFFVGNI